MKKYTVSCLGFGMRGEIYLTNMSKLENEYEIVSVCDFNLDRIKLAKELFSLNEDNLFNDDDQFFSQVRSDLLVIGTQDKDHVPNLLRALKAGYKNILIEKPYATSFDEISKVETEVKKYNANIYVCHVLRYAPAFLKAKEYIDEGKIGELKSIEALERVGYLHQSHSYVRGHYKNSELSSPMIMAKCCHDLDLLVWYSNSLCDSVSSIGSLSFFVPKNKPLGASDRCFNCKYKGSCVFDAYTLYKENGGTLLWAREYTTSTRPLTDEVLFKELEANQFGECVFNGQNNVVDNQHVMVKFKNGVEATLHMTAFLPWGGRRYSFYGTKGFIELDETFGTFTYVNDHFNRETTEISSLISAKEGHGGGDAGLVKNLYHLLNGESAASCTSLEYSIESHKMALYAEESRLQNGKVIKL